MEENTTHHEYTRYTNKNGKTESENSAKVFREIYLPTEPTPSYTQLAKLSGFAERTCRNWIYQYDYRQRKQDTIQQREQEKQNAIKNQNSIIAPLLAQINRDLTQQTITTINDTTKRQQQLSKLDTTSPERKTLHHETQDNNKTYQLLLQNLQDSNKYDDYLKQSGQKNTIIEELLEKAEDNRTRHSLETTNRLEEEYEDEEY